MRFGTVSTGCFYAGWGLFVGVGDFLGNKIWMPSIAEDEVTDLLTAASRKVDFFKYGFVCASVFFIALILAQKDLFMDGYSLEQCQDCRRIEKNMEQSQLTTSLRRCFKMKGIASSFGVTLIASLKMR